MKRNRLAKRFFTLCLTKSNQIFHQTAKITTDPDVTNQDNVVRHLVAGRRSLLAGARIDRSKFHVEPIENGVGVIFFVALFENFPVELLHEDDRSPTSQNVSAAG